MHDVKQWKAGLSLSSDFQGLKVQVCVRGWGGVGVQRGNLLWLCFFFEHFEIMLHGVKKNL